MRYFFLLLILLTACLVPEPEPMRQQQTIEPEQEKIALPQSPDRPVTLAVKTVAQDEKGNRKYYGYDEQGRLVNFESDKGSWSFIYDKDRITKILGPRDYLLDFGSGEIVEQGKFITVEHDDRGRLVLIGLNPPLHFEWDSNDDLRIVTRGVSGKTSLDYDDEHNVKYITRGSVTSNVRYDDKDRVRVINADDVSYIVGYWKDSKLMKVTGSLQGEGMEVSYGPDYPPTAAEIISAQDETEFTAPDTETLYSTVDMYIYCNYVRRLPVPFDGVSYSLFNNYFNGTVEDYIVLNKLCEVFE